MKHSKLKTVVIIGISLLLGYVLAVQLNAFLGISFTAKDLPQEAAYTPGPPLAPSAPLAPVNAIVLPDGALQDDLYTNAAAALADQIEARSGQRPAIVDSPTAALAGRQILVGAANAPDQAAALRFATPEAFVFAPFAAPDSSQSLAIVGGGRSGDVYGLYRLADDVLGGVDEATLTGETRSFTPALAQRLVDLGAVGIPQDPARWDAANYSHHLRAFEDVFLAEPPYIDEAEFAEVEQQFHDYVQRMIAYGNNGIVIPGFLEFIDFDRVEDGQAIYPADSEYRARSAALREHFGRLFQYADDMGMEVILYTDMLALTPPLQSYLENRFGSLDTENPELWEVYRLGLEELFDALPALDGVMIRIGEAGGIYNLPGWDYGSELAVRSVEATQAMLEAFLQAAEPGDKSVIFRTWSVGVGEVGDMHTNPESYARLLDAVDSPNLVVSTKYVQGDFYSFLPFNPTLEEGQHQRLVEMQNRLEFEGFMAFPDFVAPLHQASLQELRAANPQIDGVWAWNQNGGPQQAGPMSLYPFYGFWQAIDANSFVTSRAAWEPDADPAELARSWVRRTFGPDPAVAEPLTELFFLSRPAALQGLYINPFAQQQVRGLGLELTPQMWIFEWDIVDGSSSILSSVYLTVKDDVEAAIAEGFEAVALVEQMQQLAASVDRAAVVDPALLDTLAASLDYERDLFETLAWYRSAFLRYYQWLDTGDRAVFDAWQEAFAQYQQRVASHEARYGADLDFPAYNFFAAEAGMAHAQRGLAMARLARGLLLLLLLTLLAGSGVVARRTRAYPGKTGLQALWQALISPFRRHDLPPPTRADWLAATVLPFGLVALVYLTFSAFLSLHYALLTLLMLGGFVGVLFLLNLGQRSRLAWIAALLAALLAPTLLLAAVVSLRGPGGFWYQFWTDATWRTAFVTLNVAAIVWLLAVLYGAQRCQLGLGATAAIGRIFVAIGASLALLGLVPAVFGLERMLTAINDEMVVLPPGLSRILGITVHLDIPLELPVYMLAAGGVLVLIGVALILLGRLRRPKQMVPARAA
jgi:hypothetical protein